MKKLKTFESYERTGVHGVSSSQNRLSRDEINTKIKEIITNIINTKKYIEMLIDTTEHVHELVINKYPKSTQSFFNELYERDDFLAESVEAIFDTLKESLAIVDLTEILDNIEQIEQYTKDNFDELLNQNIEDTIEEEEDEDEDEIQEIDYEELPIKTSQKTEEEDQLKRKVKPNQQDIKEAIKSKEDLKKFIEKHRDKVGTFLKGERVYINGIKSGYAKKYNGKECIIVGKSKDKEDCWDLYDPSGAKVKSGEANIQDMPTKYLSLKKEEETKIATKSKVGIKPKSK